MKKLIRKYVLLIAVFSILFTASCTSSQSKTEPSPTAIPYRQYTDFKEYYIGDLNNDNEIVPAELITVYSKFKETLTSLTDSFALDDYIEVYDENDNAYNNEYRINIYQYCYMTAISKSDTIFKYQFNYDIDEMTTEDIKSIFAAAVFALGNNSYTIEQAKEQAQEIVNSNIDYGRSDIFYINNYTVYTSSSQYGSVKSLYAFSPNNMVPSAEELSSYEALSYETAKNYKMNEGMKTVIHGTLDTYTMDNILCYYASNVYMLFTDNNGQKYKLRYDYADLPFTFNTQEYYTFYCSIVHDTYADDDKPLLEIEWYAQ